MFSIITMILIINNPICYMIYWKQFCHNVDYPSNLQTCSIEIQYVTEHFRISVEKIFIDVFIIEEISFRTSQQSIRILLKCLFPSLERYPADVKPNLGGRYTIQGVGDGYWEGEREEVRDAIQGVSNGCWEGGRKEGRYV